MALAPEAATLADTLSQLPPLGADELTDRRQIVPGQLARTGFVATVRRALEQQGNFNVQVAQAIDTGGGGGGPPTGPAGGDLSGLYPNPSVAFVGGVPAADVAARLPTTDQKAALAGTDGTPGAGNPYVTSTDPRNSDARMPTGPASGDLTGSYPGPLLTATGVIPGTFGDAMTVPVVTVDAKGRLTAVVSTPIAFPTVPKPPFIDTFDIGGIEAMPGSGATNAVDGQAIYYPIVVPSALTVSALQTRVINITGGSTWSLSMGIYNYDDATRAPTSRVFFGTVAGIVAAANISITTFTGSPALTAGRYFLAVLPVLTAGAGNLRRLTPNDLNNTDVGIAVSQYRQQVGLATLPASATPAAFTVGTQLFWHRVQVALP